MKFIFTSTRLCFCLWFASMLAIAQETCVLTSDPTTKTVKLTGNCGAIAAVKTQAGYTVENNNQTQQALPPMPAEPPKLEDMSAVPPIVTYENGQLKIVARNSTLNDILEAVRSQTGTEFDIPEGASKERVVSQIGPGPARDVLATLLNGSHFNYVMLGTEADPNAFARLVLTPKSETSTPSNAENAMAARSVQPPPPVFSTPKMTADIAASTDSSPEAQTEKPGHALGLTAKDVAAITASAGSSSAIPMGEVQPGQSGRALLPQLIPHTLPAWELQQVLQQQGQATAQQQPESADIAPVANQTATPDTAAQPAAASSPNSPESVTASDAQPPQNSNSVEPQTPTQVLESLYGARRAMIEQQRRAQAAGQQ